MKQIGPLREFMHDNAVIGFTGDTALSVLELMDKYHVRHIPILDRNFGLYRIVTDKDILDLIGKNPSMYAFRMSIDKMTRQNVITLTPEDDLTTAIVAMIDNKISCIPVVDGDDIVGIITVRDILGIDKLWAKIDNPSLNPFEDIVGQKILADISISPDHSLWQILDLLSHSTTRNLLLYERGLLTGLVSTLILINEIIEFNRRLLSFRNNINFEQYLFTTSLQDVLIEYPIFAKAPVLLDEVRHLMINHNTTAIILGNRKQPLRIITERDMFNFLNRQFQYARHSPELF